MRKLIPSPVEQLGCGSTDGSLEHMTGPGAAALKAACEVIEDQEDEHVYHTKGWCRELWIQSLGLSPVLPPPEDRQHVKTAIAAKA